MKHLLFLHGALGSKKNFEQLINSLDNQYQIHSMDFEGHGEFISEQEFSIELFTQNTLDYINKASLSKVSIFGYSMGGYVALNLASKHPELIEKIVTYGTKFNWTPDSATQEVKMLNPEKIEEKIPKFAAHLKDVQLPSDWKKVMKKTAELMLNLGQDPIIQSKLASIQSEVKIGISNADKMVSIEESKHTAEQLQNGTLLEFGGLPHPIDQIPNQELVDLINREF